MKDFFRERQNRPASVSDIAEAAGASPETVRSILYKRNRGRFVKDAASLGWQMAEFAPQKSDPKSHADDVATQRLFEESGKDQGDNTP